MNIELSRATWRKSTYSNGTGGDCVEATSVSGMVAVRDSKHPHGPKLLVTPGQWRAFTESVRLPEPE